MDVEITCAILLCLGLPRTAFRYLLNDRDRECIRTVVPYVLLFVLDACDFSGVKVRSSRRFLIPGTR